MEHKEDDDWMQVALEQARLGLGTTSPNPPVGAVIVSSRGVLLGKGHHKQAGGPHAEIEALRSVLPSQVGEIAGSTAYVTLEPCSTHGRTPPCSNALVAAGVRRVVWAIDDPNPAHAGRAMAFFASKGIATHRGVQREPATQLLRPWTCFMTKHRPYCVAKVGMSIDARLTRPAGEGQWLSSAASRADAMLLRVHSDAILVGGATARADNPSLTIRPAELAPALKKQPLRVVWTSQPLPGNGHLVNDEHAERTVCLDSPTPQAILEDLYNQGVVQLLIEGGGRVMTQFLAAGLVDEMHVYLAPFIVGNGVPLTDSRLWGLNSSREFVIKEVKPIVEDVKIVYQAKL